MTGKKETKKVKILEICESISKVLNILRIVPRTVVMLYGYVFWDITVWFMELEDPTAQQAAFVSTIVGAGAAFFGLYVNSGKNNGE